MVSPPPHLARMLLAYRRPCPCYCCTVSSVRSSNRDHYIMNRTHHHPDRQSGMRRWGRRAAPRWARCTAPPRHPLLLRGRLHSHQEDGSGLKLLSHPPRPRAKPGQSGMHAERLFLQTQIVPCRSGRPASAQSWAARVRATTLATTAFMGSTPLRACFPADSQWAAEDLPWRGCALLT